MKRSQPATTSPTPSSPAHKKVKMSPNPFEVLPDNTEDGWTKVEKRKAKKAKKTEAKIDAPVVVKTRPARFMYNSSEIIKRTHAVGISDIRDLVLHLVADAPPPSWVRIENPRSIQKVVVLLAVGMTGKSISLPPISTSAMDNPNVPVEIPFPPPPETPLPFIASKFSHACPTRAPGETTKMYSALSAFFQVPVTGEEKKRRQQERMNSEHSQPKSALRYLLTLEQMIEHEYPVPSYMADIFQAPEDWVEIPLIKEGGFPDIYGIDCEMCLTEEGKTLARVCLINYISGKVVYDELVKPERPITDYLTRWSGITEESIAKATTTFAEVRDRLGGILSAKPTPVLVGHSLESDLRALKMSHPRCIDTAVIYHHPRGRPLKPGLAWLTKKWCRREIQNRGEGGHDPEEDARACLELLKKKVENGPGYGEFKTDQESILERISRSTRSGGVKTAVVDYGTPASWHGVKATASVACKTDEDVVNGVLEVLPNNHLVFGRLLELSDTCGWITGKAAYENIVTEFVDSDAEVTTDPVKEAAAAADLNQRLSRIYDALPPRTAFIVFSGHSDPRKMSKLNSRKAAFEIALRMGMPPTSGPTTWTAQDGRDLESEVELAKRGFLFLCIKDAQ